MATLHRTVEALCTLPHRRPWTLVLVAFALASLGGYLYFDVLEIQSGRGQLSDSDSPLERRLRDYTEQFGVEDTVILVVSVGPPEGSLGADPPSADDRARMKTAGRLWAERLRERPELFPEVVERASVADMGPLALLYLPDEAIDLAVDAIQGALGPLAEWADNPTLANLFEVVRGQVQTLGANGGGGSRDVLAAGLRQAEHFVEWFRAELDSDTPVADLGDTLSAALGFGDFDGQGYLFIADGRYLIVPAAVRGDASAQNEYGEVIEYALAARELALGAVGGSVQAGLVGVPALEYEELVTSQADFARSAWIALLLVSVLFVVSFHSLLRPALAALCLGLSIGTTFVFTWLAIGHLNLLAMVFAIILVALGIDFAIHFATHYELALSRGDDSAGAIASTLRKIGVALIMGGLTTAAAFLAAGFTKAPGLSELGIIAGGGVVICTVVMCVVYPALLHLMDRRRTKPPPVVPAPAPETMLPPGRAARICCAGVAVVALAGFLLGSYEFDTNLLALQPTAGESVRWQKVLLGADDRTRFAIATYRDRESLERVRAEFSRRAELVRATDSVFPENEARKRAKLEPLCADARAVELGDPAPGNILRSLSGLKLEVAQLAEATPEAEEALSPLSDDLAGAYAFLRGLPAAQRQARVARVERAVVAALAGIRDRVAELCCPPEFAVELAPGVLRRRFVGDDGSLALLIYPTENTWESDARERFVEGATAIEPRLFGGVVNFSANARDMIESCATAAIYSLIAVLALVVLWCRSLRDSLFTLVPLATSIGLLVAIMPAVGLSWNFANFFALPILIGVGVDSGIHLTRGFKGGAATFQGAKRAVLISTLTTLIGFGILGSSQHLGIRSLGLILTIGIACVLLTSLFLLPIALRTFSRTQHAPSPS